MFLLSGNLNPRNSVHLFPDLTNQIGSVIFASERSMLLGLPYCCSFDHRIDLSTVLAPHGGSTRKPQRVLNRLEHRQVIVDSKNAVPAQHRWPIHG
jgi:hypothetical protein